MGDRAPLLRLLDAGMQHGGLRTDDVLTLVLPLLRQVAALHELGEVAALDGVDSFATDDGGRLSLARSIGAKPTSQRSDVERVQAPTSSVLQVVGESRLTQEAEAGIMVENLIVTSAEGGAELRRPVYLPGYVAWERTLGHHDAMADILCLGQVLASLACGLDFTESEDLRLFAANRHDLFKLREGLHPVIAGVIGEMTELNRHSRAQDLPSIIRRLETYREQPQDLQFDRVVAGQGGAQQHRRAVQIHLRDRLFDLSRRNRLLHFRATHSSVNLTVASVPLVVDLKSIRQDQLCVWTGGFQQQVLTGDVLPLARWLRFEDQPYLPASLDRIIHEARRDRAEYGLSQLSLVVAFLRWHNLKEDRNERIVSPLLLLPVELTRKKGVRDQYLLQAHTTEAEVNPVLRQQLRQVYGIELPETVDLRDDRVAAFHTNLQNRIGATEPGVKLRLIAQPEIELIHQRARQRLEQYRRRRPIEARPTGRVASIDYSYSADDYRPLGLKLFHERVQPAALPLRQAVGGAPAPRHPTMVPSEAESTTFALRESSGNAYQWDLDLTMVTLGNFNYRRMSLVRDYNALAESDLANAAFDQVFSLNPRSAETEVPAPLALAEQWTVVPADSTQLAAVAFARTGASYIIQGPPGTGKSQTITNLIADYVGQGKAVLFVCEKRAAIDVVFHRLRQQGLDELCCMIHDSQADKKAFVQNLKQTYEHWLATDDGLDNLELVRKGVLADIQQDAEALQRFDDAMRSAPSHIGHAVRTLVHRLVELREHAVDLPPVVSEALPPYEAWRQHGALVVRLEQTLRETVGVSALAAHVFGSLSAALVQHERPLGRLAELTDQCEALLDRASDALPAAWPEMENQPWAVVQLLVDQARQLRPLAKRELLTLLEASSESSRALDAALVDVQRRQAAASSATTVTAHWRDKLTPADTAAALVQARGQEGSPLRWLTPGWWRLRSELLRRYDFSPHAVRPRFSQVLGELAAEQQAQAELKDAQQAFETRYGTVNSDAFRDALREMREAGHREPAMAKFHDLLLRGNQGSNVIEDLVALGSETDALDPVLRELLVEPHEMPFSVLGETVRDLREAADALPDLLPLLRELASSAAAFGRTLRKVDLPAAGIEYAIARENLERVYREERWLVRFDGAVLARHVERLATGERKLQGLNAKTARATVRRRFRDNVRRSTLSVSQLDDHGRLFKKAYTAGRRELEHEFGKSMRFKAIRELASAESGRVVRDMKPIWLMSPLSVSDTLPLAADLFDVVIFDEASQIPVEEAVPALYRGPQVIVVGDEMQLPPTSFFSAGRDGEEDTLDVEEEGERLSVILDADSLLNQGARNLPATLLAWHYRSRSESLIGFSNAAFYAGSLYTIPDRRLPGEQDHQIGVRSKDAEAAEIAEHTTALLSRPISFHSVTDSVYANRRNDGEARYIARLVRELLQRETGLSIGIVAFSEAQQSEIESALDALAMQDSTFGTQLEAEYIREEDDQFCGLFVKNLENVQGDERDVIILSICYGPGADGRMLMNFGPINQRGGEKRLNVIFSRARHHMAVVSTIRHDAITNDYNDGAAALKQFLRYAEAASRGKMAAAQQVLEGLNPLAGKALGAAIAPDEVVAQLAAALRDRGFTVEQRVGQSRFRCDLGVRRADQEHHRLAVLVDTELHYTDRDVYERFVSRPRILSSFGWKVVQVLSRDWLHDPQAVLNRVERAFDDEAEALGDANEMDEQSELAAPLAAVEAASPAVRGADAQPLDARGRTRYFECTEGGARKFWRINHDGTDVTVTFGRLGTRGQTQLKQFANEQRAQQEVHKLVAEKLKKGYAEEQKAS